MTHLIRTLLDQAQELYVRNTRAARDTDPSAVIFVQRPAVVQDEYFQKNPNLPAQKMIDGRTALVRNSRLYCLERYNTVSVQRLCPPPYTAAAYRRGITDDDNPRYATDSLMATDSDGHFLHEVDRIDYREDNGYGRGASIMRMRNENSRDREAIVAELVRESRRDLSAPGAVYRAAIAAELTRESGRGPTGPGAA